MKPSGRFFQLYLVCCLGASAASCAEAVKAGPRLILFLTADGFRTDYIEWYNPPALKRLIAEGTRITWATNVFPTVTTPNMTALVTGSYPRTTGIAANSEYIRERDEIVSSPRDNQATTIAETLKQTGWKTAAVNHFMLKNRGADVFVDAGYDDSEKTTDAILEILKTNHPRFMGAIYGATDHAGHKHGPESAEVKAAVLGIDAAVARLLEGLKAMGLYEDTLIAFTADHGMSAFEMKPISKEPAKALEEAGFKVATSQKLLNPETQLIVLPEGVRIVYFRKALSEEQKGKVLRVLKAITGAEVLDRERLDALGCHNNRSGDFILSPLPGFTMSRAGETGGQHGRFSERNPILFFHGPGVRQGATIPGDQTIDVVPTLLHLAGVAPAATVDGRSIKAVLQGVD